MKKDFILLLMQKIYQFTLSLIKIIINLDNYSQSDMNTLGNIQCNFLQNQDVILSLFRKSVKLFQKY